MSHAHKTHSIVNMRAPHKYHTRKICTSFLILLFFSSFMPLIRLSLCLIHRCACIAIGARGWRANVEICSSDKSNPNGIQHTFWIRTIVRLYNHSVNVGWAKRKKNIYNSWIASKRMLLAYFSFEPLRIWSMRSNIKVINPKWKPLLKW